VRAIIGHRYFLLLLNASGLYFSSSVSLHPWGIVTGLQRSAASRLESEGARRDTMPAPMRGDRRATACTRCSGAVARPGAPECRRPNRRGAHAPRDLHGARSSKREWLRLRRMAVGRRHARGRYRQERGTCSARRRRRQAPGGRRARAALLCAGPRSRRGRARRRSIREPNRRTRQHDCRQRRATGRGRAVPARHAHRKPRVAARQRTQTAG